MEGGSSVRGVEDPDGGKGRGKAKEGTGQAAALPGSGSHARRGNLRPRSSMPCFLPSLPNDSILPLLSAFRS